MAEKLYVVVRADLPPGLQLSQVLHAARQFQAEHTELEEVWFKSSNTVAILSVTQEEELKELLKKAHWAELKTSSFREPDLDNSLTAIALQPGNKSGKLLRRLPLALST